MKKYTILTVLLLLLCGLAAAQDMPLATILVKGQDWQRIKIEGGTKPPTSVEANGFLYSGKTGTNEIIYAEISTPDKRMSQPLPLKNVGTIGVWNDRHTLVVADADGRHLWAFRIEKDGKLTAGDKYYALAAPRGQVKLAVAAIACDPMNRLYAAAENGIQIFDPTARLCGVITCPIKEPVERIAFTDDAIEIFSKENAFSRKLQIQPPKKK
jgi:hypothetical protein